MISHKALVVLSVIFCIIICCNGDLKECNNFLLKVGFRPDLGIYNIIFIYQFDDVNLFKNHVQSIPISTENGTMLDKIKDGLELYYKYSVELRSEFISSFKKKLKTPEEFCTLVGINLDPECKNLIKQYEFALPNISDAGDKGNEENNKFKSYLTSINIAYTYISEKGDKGNEGKKELNRLFDNIHKTYTDISKAGKNKNKEINMIYGTNGYEQIKSYTYISEKALTRILKADNEKIDGMTEEVFEYYQKLLCMSVELYQNYAFLTTSYLCELISPK